MKEAYLSKVCVCLVLTNAPLFVIICKFEKKNKNLNIGGKKWFYLALFLHNKRGGQKGDPISFPLEGDAPCKKVTLGFYRKKKKIK